MSQTTSTPTTASVPIAVEVDGTVLSGSLTTSPAAQDLAELLPLTVTLRDFHGVERIADLPRRLTTTGEPSAASARPGDIAFYAPWGNLALFYGDQPKAAGLVVLGRLDPPAALVLAELAPQAAVMIRRASTE